MIPQGNLPKDILFTICSLTILKEERINNTDQSVYTEQSVYKCFARE